MIRDARGLRRPLLACAVFAALAAAPAAFAASFVVTNTNTSGSGSLADAIAQANGAAGPHTITFAVTGTIPVSGGGFTLTEAITISGPGLPSDLALDGGDASRILTIAGGAAKPVALQNLTLSNANVMGSNGGAVLVNPGNTLTISSCSLVLNTTDSSGGALANLGTTTIANATFGNNFTSGGTGGAVYNVGTMVVTGSTFASNDAPNDGGAISNDSAGTLTLTDSTFAGNSASANGGGGGALGNNGSATILRCTFSGNSAVGYGGAIRADASGAPGFGKLDVVNSTFTGNVTNGNGGGVLGSVNAGTVRIFSSTFASNAAMGTALGGAFFVSSSTVLQLSNSILSGNTAPAGNGQDCSGTIASSGYNLVSSLEACTVSGTTTGNVTGVAANLGALANNGGPTQTMALNAGSPALDAGNPAGCVDQNGATLGTDQRNLPRPSGGRCDMGAFEVQVAPAALTVSKSAAASVVSGQTLTYTLTYGNTGGTAATSVVLRDTVPAGTTFVSATNGGSLVAGDVVWNVASLGAGVTGQTVSFTVTVTAANGVVSNGTYSIAATGITPVAGSAVTTAVQPAGGPGGIKDVPALSPLALAALGLALGAAGMIAMKRIGIS